IRAAPQEGDADPPRQPRRGSRPDGRDPEIRGAGFMNGVLVILEQRPHDGRPVWNRMTWEALAAGRQLASQVNQPLSAAVAGARLDELRRDLGAKPLDGAWLVEHDSLKAYTADGFTGALDQLIERLDPAFVVFPHTYQVRDFAPRLAARRRQTLIADVIGL